MNIETTVRYVIILLLIGQFFSVYFCMEKNDDLDIYGAIGVMGSMICTVISFVLLAKWSLSL